MLLDPMQSECELHQKEFVCREAGERRIYRVINPNGEFEVRKYRLDGNLVKNEMCCDFTVINDTSKMVYYVELKGRDVGRAVEQLLAGEKICRGELPEYISFYRIIASKSPTTRTEPKNFRNLKEKVGRKRFICKTDGYEEKLIKREDI